MPTGLPLEGGWRWGWGSFSHLLHKNLLSIYYVQDFCGSWGFDGEQEAPWSGSRTPSRPHQVPFMPRETKGAPHHSAQTEPWHRAGLSEGYRDRASLQAPSGCLCEQVGRQVWVSPLWGKHPRVGHLPPDQFCHF